VNRGAQRYIFEGGIDEVEGWLDPGAVTATLAIDYLQKATNVRGSVAEIGVHHGKYFIVLKNLCRSDEFAIAVDVFEDQHLNIDGSGSGDRAIFEHNISRYSDSDNLSVIKSDSKRLDSANIIAAGRGNMVRIFSIDGSHTADHSYSDLMLAAGTLATGGVIVLDDLYNPAWPGVQEGFHRFMNSMNTRFSVISFGDNKLYLCSKSDHEKFLCFFEEELRQCSGNYKKVIVWGSDALSMSLRSPDQVFTRNGEFPVNNFFLAGAMVPPRCKLISGWGQLEQGNGVWTIGDVSTLGLRLAHLPRSGELTLRMDVTPFLHRQRASRRIDIFINEKLMASPLLTSGETIVLPVDVDLLREETILTLKTESPEEPSKFLASEDSRKIGVKLRSISLS
jgi:hypothetical protein